MDNDNTLNRNDYDGNGWSKYQKLVMAQLEGHTRLLETLNAEINTVKQQYALQKLAFDTWKEDITLKTADLRKDITYMWHDDRGFHARLNNIEQATKVEERSILKIKGWWALIGGSLVLLVDIVVKAVEFFSHTAPHINP